MPKLTAEPVEEISLEYIRQRISGEITRQYKMNVQEFCRSENCTRLGLNPISLPMYLSGGSNSFAELGKAYKALGLGELTRTKVTVITYFSQRD